MQEEHELDSEMTASDLMAGLDPSGPPRLAFVRRAPGGITGRPGHLLCLSASFNPMTLAHVWLIQEASRVAPPDEVLLLLAKANVDKEVTGFPLERRLTFLCRYAEPRPNHSVAAVNHGRFVDKVQAIPPNYPPGTRLTFILGFDTLVRLFESKYYADREASLATLFAGSEFIVANRAPDPVEAIDSFLARPDVAPYAHSIQVIRFPEQIAAISATAARNRLACGEPVNDLVPPEVLPLLHLRRRKKGLSKDKNAPRTPRTDATADER